MIRTVWLSIACLIALAGLTVLKMGTGSFVQEAAAPSEQAAANLVSDTAVSDVLPKGDRLDAADEDDAIKPVRPIAITTRVADAASAETSSSEDSWRSSYAKRDVRADRHRKAKLHRTARRHRSYHASRSHAKSRYAVTSKNRKMARR
jgi:hypothetical protein